MGEVAGFTLRASGRDQGEAAQEAGMNDPLLKISDEEKAIPGWLWILNWWRRRLPLIPLKQ